MRDVVVYLARALVDDPDRVTVEELPTGRGVTYEVRTAPDDVGKLIGRGGRTVKALRRVDELFRLGVRVLVPVHLRDNQIGTTRLPWQLYLSDLPVPRRRSPVAG